MEEILKGLIETSNNELQGLSNGESAIVGGSVGMAFGIFIGICIAISIVWCVLGIIACWRVFKKAGEAGWKSIIPFYNGYIMYKLSWKTIFFWIMLVLSIVTGILTSLTSSSTIVTVILDIVLIATAVISIIQMHKLSKSFGHGAGFTVGLIFLNSIFMLILGFGKSEYIGNTSENQQ